MFAGLDKVDWASLGHAYGSAEDVPDLLRQLASDDADERESAMYELHGNIWHQGTVYEATAAAVPFLLEVLAESDSADKPGILIFLSELTNGGSYCDVHQNLKSSKAECETDEWTAQLAKELNWVRQAREAVKTGSELYLAILAHGAAEEREAAGFLLATLDQPNPKTAATLWNQYERETDSRCRASLLMGLGLASAADATSQSLMLNAFVQMRSGPERVAAALSLARLFPDNLEKETLAEIVSSWLNPQFEQVLDATPWGIVHGIEPIIDTVLLGLKGKAEEHVIRDFELLMENGQPNHSFKSAQALLRLAFREPLRPETSFESLTERQRHTVIKLAKHRARWIPSNTSTRVEDLQKTLIAKLSPSDMTLRKLLNKACGQTGQAARPTRSFWSRWWRHSSEL